VNCLRLQENFFGINGFGGKAMKAFGSVLEIWKKGMRNLFCPIIHISIGLIFVFLGYVSFSGAAFAEDRLIVKDASGNATFRVEDLGFVYTKAYYLSQSPTPGFWLDETGSGNKGAFLVLDNRWLQVQRRNQGFGDYEASPVFINIDAPSLSIFVAPNGYVGLGVFANYPLQMASGAHVTSGGVWTNASSREYKQDIKSLTKWSRINRKPLRNCPKKLRRLSRNKWPN